MFAQHTAPDTPDTAPRLPRGFRDLSPAHTQLREELIQKAIAVCRNRGLVPLSTPCVEYLDILTKSGSEETRQQTFHVTGPDGESLGLRYELTMSLARHIAEHRNLMLPFSRYQYGPVWRADKPGPARFREFFQFDFDVVGAASELADAEIIALQYDILAAFGFEPVIHLSSRGVLNRLLDYAFIPQDLGPSVFRVLDKRDKIGFFNVRRELADGYVDSSGAKIPGVGLTRRQIARLQAFLDIRGSERADVIAQIRDVLRNVHGASEEIDSLERVSNELAEHGYGDDRVVIDVSVVRGLEYYTGSIFEVVVPGTHDSGACGGGGRYDSLLRKFLGHDVPAVGASIGVDRVIAALDYPAGRNATARVLVTNFDPAFTSDYVKMTWDLRRGGIAAELYMGSEQSIGRQLKYANHRGVPLVVICGSDERANGTVTLKNMLAGQMLAAGAGVRGEWLALRAGEMEVKREDLVTSAARLLQEIGQPA